MFLGIQTKKFHVIRWLQLTVLIGILTVSFNNCSQKKSSDDSSNDQASTSAGPFKSTGDVCEDSLISLYSRGYHIFTKQHCASCHTNGPGKGKFATEDVNVAYDDFKAIGYSKLSDNATTISHNGSAEKPEIGGNPNNINEISLLKKEWAQGLTEYTKCSGIEAPTSSKIEELVSLELQSQKIGSLADNASKDIKWEPMNQRLFSIKAGVESPNLPGANFSIQITKGKTSAGDTYYAISKPIVYSATKDIRFKGIHVKINGRLQKFPTTFKFVDKSIRAGSKVADLSGLISTGGMVIPGVLSDADEISVVFETIEIVDMGPVPVPSKVQFTASAISMTSDYTKTVDPNNNKKYITLNLAFDKATDDESLIDLRIETPDYCTASQIASTKENGYKLDTCLANGSAYTPLKDKLVSYFNGKIISSPSDAISVSHARSRFLIDSNNNRVKRFNWDFDISATQLIIPKGTSSLQVKVYISSDERWENNRILSLKLSPQFGPLAVGNNSQIYLLFDKRSNTRPSPGDMTYSQLANPAGGVFSAKCNRCHNTILRTGDYDIAEYDDLVLFGRVIPGNGDGSPLYKRILPFAGIKPMPPADSAERISGDLAPETKEAIRVWINNGAKNN